MFSTLSALRGAKTISREFVSGICEKLTDLEGGDALFELAGGDESAN